MKKKYLKPEIEEVKIDTTVTLMSMSGDKATFSPNDLDEDDVLENDELG